MSKTVQEKTGVQRKWWHIGDRHKARARLKRRGFPIHGYVGPNGSGKSWAATYDGMLSLDYGRPILSTVRLLDFRDPGECPGGLYCDDPDGHMVKKGKWELVEQDEPGSPPLLHMNVYETGEIHRKRHPFYVPWRSYQQLLEWRDGDVFADEITGFASSREIKNMPPQVANYLVQLRRRNVILRWTTPSWGRADTIIREVTQAVTLAVGQLGIRRPTPAGEAPRLWRDNRAFLIRTYDPHQFDEVEAKRMEHAKAEAMGWYWRPKGLTMTAYDTLDSVSALGWANEAGVCIGCGGERRRSKCSCPADHGQAAGPPARKRSGAGVPADRGGSSLSSSSLPLISQGKVLGMGAPVSDAVSDALPEAQEAAGEVGTLNLVDAISLSAAEWSAQDGD